MYLQIKNFQESKLSSETFFSSQMKTGHFHYRDSPLLNYLMRFKLLIHLSLDSLKFITHIQVVVNTS